jgi:hypothetical protein
MSDDEKRALITKALESISGMRRVFKLPPYKDFVVIDNQRKIIYAPTNLPLQFKISDDGTYYLERENLLAKLSMISDKAFFEYIPPTFKTGLRMAISWDRKTISEERSYNFSPSHIDDLNESITDYDTLIGLIFAASFFPQPKKLFPERVGLPGGNYEQYMREAQVPLLALMYRTKLTDSPFFKAVEQYIGS